MKEPMLKNLFSDVTSKTLPEEVFQTLCQGKSFRLERIISSGQTTPENEWLIQSEDEWVILLAGSAKILFEKNKQEYSLKSGDYLLIPANMAHKVTWTDPNNKSIWLAIHFVGDK